MRAALVLLLTCVNTLAASSYTQAMYRRALGDEGPERVVVSSAPLYVLITLRDHRNHSERVVAIFPSSLFEAILTEYHLPNDDTRWEKTFQIAAARPGRVFAFSNPRALRMLQPRYTSKVLEEVRRLLSSKSRSQLVAEADNPDSPLHRIYDSKTSFQSAAAYRDAIAHVLLEKGILVGQGDYVPLLYVDHYLDP